MESINYDQHFMVDEDLIKRIAKQSSARDVIEIGPGKGALTEELLKARKKVTAYEIDPEKVKFLENKFSKEISNGKLKIINANILDEKIVGKVIYSNLPYSISEPLFYKLIKSDVDHIYLVTGEKFYKLLIGAEKIGFFRKNFFKIDFYESISKTAFSPQPRVNSTFFALHRKQNDDFYNVFLGQYDKKLKNAIIESFCRFYEISKKEAKVKLLELGIKEEILLKRIYHLSNLQFMAVIEVINEKL